MLILYAWDTCTVFLLGLCSLKPWEILSAKSYSCMLCRNDAMHATGQVSSEGWLALSMLHRKPEEPRSLCHHLCPPKWSLSNNQEFENLRKISLEHNSYFPNSISLEIPSIGFCLKSYPCWVSYCFHYLLPCNKLPQPSIVYCYLTNCPKFSYLLLCKKLPQTSDIYCCITDYPKT